jgi:phosphoribosylformylglycinamidine synthase
MSRPKALILRAAGTNCDGETAQALRLAGAEPELLHLHRVLEEPARLDEVSLLVIAGGFSYGDDVAAGRVFGLELRHHLHSALDAFVARGGFVLGVCNGFQILIETGLLDAAPETGTASAPPQATRDVALTGNASDRFECRWVTLREEDCACSWLNAGELLPCPAAHAEGRFVVRDTKTLERLRVNRQIALRYVTAGGGSPSYPDNPNGSIDDIAGICDPTGRVLGLMPHPERNVTPWHDLQWTRSAALGHPPREGAGLGFWRRLVEASAMETTGVLA